LSDFCDENLSTFSLLDLTKLIDKINTYEYDKYNVIVKLDKINITELVFKKQIRKIK
jgi:hypothetical protein